MKLSLDADGLSHIMKVFLAFAMSLQLTDVLIRLKHSAELTKKNIAVSLVSERPNSRNREHLRLKSHENPYPRTFTAQNHAS